MPVRLSSGRRAGKREQKHHNPWFFKQGRMTLPALGPIPGAELEAELSVASRDPSIFSLFSTCFFSVRVLEGRIGNRGR